MSDVLTGAGVLITLVVSVFAAWRAWRTDSSSTTRADFDSLRDELRKQLDDKRAENEELEGRVSKLEADSRHDKRQRSLAMTYIGLLVQTMRSSGVAVPDPPTELEVDLDG